MVRRWERADRLGDSCSGGLVRGGSSSCPRMAVQLAGLRPWRRDGSAVVSAERVSFGTAIFVLESFPVVLNLDELACDVVGAFRSQEQGQLDLFFRRHATGKANLTCRLDFGFIDIVSGAQDLVGHAGVRSAWKHGIDLHVVVPNFLGKAFHKSGDRGLTG